MTDRTDRARNLGIAAGLALVAALLTMLYVSRAQGGTKPAAAAQLTNVLVATRDLSIGTPFTSALASGAVATKQVPADAVTPGALTSAAALRGEVVVQPIYAHEQITAKRFGTTGAQGMRAVLHGDLRAITIAGDQRQLLAGTLKPGDHVDLVMNSNKVDPQHPKARIAATNMIVLQAPGGEGTFGSPGEQTLAATLQLTDHQVQVLWWAVKNGDWSLVLRPNAKATDTVVRQTNEAEVLQGSWSK